MHDTKQIVHRDLKPENILLEKEGNWENIRIIDFGTAKPFKSLVNKDGQTELRDRVGTMAYIAPEILNLNVSGHFTDSDTYYNEKCDMWSIGVIAYMLLVGKNPFLAIQDQSILKSTIKEFKAAESKYFNDEDGFLNLN